ncbi:oligosaccharide flippase family protein [Microbulbifer bruguierae]|uniref:Oligosaccharide flippase family protein n=2 Tax=Microbulbifer bruguierae TaxID=3029061 RepID=A0ABY8N9T7_9GAMM|nr:oligosaccharide flippase family protein [Microbulbifer bruguierae]WGL15245.1 oligosaccharide flippase family protein [Microbulbifer bruguierae]
MTRLLAPEMFGLMALANVVVAGVQMLTDMGINKSIIQNKDGVEQPFLNTAWALQILRGVSLAAIVWGFALTLWIVGPNGSSTNVYSHPDLPIVLAILASSLVISGFRPTKTAVANRDLQLGRITAIDLMTQIIGIVAMILWASYSPSVWALVAGTVISSVVRITAENICLSGVGNSWQWDRGYAKQIFHFGKWIFFTSLLSYWVLNGDRIILGFDINAHEMGIYSIAVFIVGSVRGALNTIMQKVMYPAMSRKLRESSDCTDMYYRFRLPLDFVICSLCGFLVVSGDQIVRLLYDERYSQAGIFLSFLSLGLIADRYRGLGLYYQAEGEPKKMMSVALSRALLLTIGLPFALFSYDLIGAVVFLGVYPIFIIPLQLYLKYKAGLMSVYREIAYTSFIVPGVAAGYFFTWLTSYVVN